VSRRAAAALAAGLFLLAAPAARAAAPAITETWVEEVHASSAKLWARINPNGSFSTYAFEYVSEAAFEQSGFANAKKIPASGAAPLGAGNVGLAANLHVEALTPATQYRYRASASNAEGKTTGPDRLFATQETSLAFHLPDHRGWELVSPIDKGGGAIAAPEALHGGGEIQAAAQGGAISYGSATAFGEAKGAPPVSQYLSQRTEAGWMTENVSAPLASAAYGNEPDGAPYRLFSEDLAQGLLFGGLPCRGGVAGCPAPTPVLAGSGAPAGYEAYYLRNSSGGAFSSLLTQADLSHTAVSPEAFAVSFAAASSDLSHLILSSCAKLTANASEAMLGAGECDPSEQNLYEKGPAGLALLNLKPGESTGTPGAQIAAPIGALSKDGSRVYFGLEGKLYLREGAQTIPVDEAQGGGGAFQAASADGSVAYFTKAGHLYRFLTSSKAATDITPAGGVVGVLGASVDGSSAYYQDATALERWREGATTQVAPGAGVALASDYPPSSATVRISADGAHLAFLSDKELIAYDNSAHTELYLYGPPVGGGAPQLLCASCNPTGERAQGDASIPGALKNGSTATYLPRVLASDGERVFFDSTDSLAVQDTNNHPDVYQWEARGEGECARSPGCLNLLSSGRVPEGASFIDASADGADAFFITAESLVGADPGSIDLYDAREGGGLPEAPKPIPCIADACQALPPTPEDPDPGTLVKNAGNPAQRFEVEKAKKKKKHHKKHKGEGKKHPGKKLNGTGKYHVPAGHKGDGGR
jgi:hypothetical protein